MFVLRHLPWVLSIYRWHPNSEIVARGLIYMQGMYIDKIYPSVSWMWGWIREFFCVSDCCESASGQVVSGNPLTFPRDRDIFSLQYENTVWCYLKKKKMEPHTMKWGEKKKHFMAVTYVGAVLKNIHAALIKYDDYFSVWILSFRLVCSTTDGSVMFDTHLNWEFIVSLATNAVFLQFYSKPNKIKDVFSIIYRGRKFCMFSPRRKSFCL